MKLERPASAWLNHWNIRPFPHLDGYPIRGSGYLLSPMKRARPRPRRTLGDQRGPRKRQEAERDETTTPITGGHLANGILPAYVLSACWGKYDGLPTRIRQGHLALPACLRPGQCWPYARNALPRRSSPCARRGSALLTVASTRPTNQALATRRCKIYAWTNARPRVPRWSIRTSALVLQ